MGNETVQRREYSGVAGDWLPLETVAGLIGVSYELLRRFVQVAGGLASLEKGGVLCVRPGEAYDHCVSNCRRRPRGLQVPPGYDLPAVAASAELAGLGLDPDVTAALAGEDPAKIEIDELSRRLLLRGVSADKIRGAVQVAHLVQRRREAEAKAAKNIPPEDVVKMMRAHGELMAEQLDASAAGFAAELVKLMRAAFGVDVVERNLNAQQTIESFYRQHGNKVIVAIHRRIEEQVKGVKLLEFTG